MPIRIAINGYGRIGRGLHRQVLSSKDFEVVAINSRAQAQSHAYLLKHDSLYGKCDSEIEVDGQNLRINGKTVHVYQTKNPVDLDWKKHGVDIVIESTGRFTTHKDVEKHLEAGAKKVLITAPCKDKTVPNIVMGVNDSEFDPEKYDVLSNASCTTNCLCPVMKVLHDSFTVQQSFVTSIHAFTYTQNLLDNSNPEDYRRARSTTESIIPTSTGAMQAVGRVIPDLAGKISGMAFRVPIPTVSCLDIVAQIDAQVSAEQVNQVFLDAEKSKLEGILGTCDEPLLSVDFRGDPRSAIIDLENTRVLSGGLIKVIAWYDNEWGYISRISDLIKWMKLR